MQATSNPNLGSDTRGVAGFGAEPPNGGAHRERLAADLADDRAVAVGFEWQCALCPRYPAPRLRNRNDELRWPARFDRRQPERLTVIIEGVVKTGLFVRRVQDGPLVKGIRHSRSPGFERAEREKPTPACFRRV